jgi:hypothetical protein
MKKQIFIAVLFISTVTFAQNDRVNDHNNTNWAQLFITKAINKKMDWLIEYQWRRADGLKNWQQGLFRTAFQYKFNSAISIAAGYAEAETFSYGDYPIAANGVFPEHRIFEQLVIKQPINKITITNRFRIEQRWLGRVKAGTDREIEGWTYLNRFRYQCRVQMPLWIKGEQQLYAIAADEIFIGAGKNVGVNIFDQNRIFLMTGFRFNKNIAVELGYFNQTLMQGKRINNNTIMQRNNGIVLSTYLSF